MEGRFVSADRPHDRKGEQRTNEVDENLISDLEGPPDSEQRNLGITVGAQRFSQAIPLFQVLPAHCFTRLKPNSVGRSAGARSWIGTPARKPQTRLP